MNVSLRQMKLFLAVARERNFSRAGSRVGLSQPAVSRSIRELEEQLGLRLLDRTTREVALTEAGVKLSGALDRLIDELENVLLEARSAGEQHRGKVRVASAPTPSAALMPGYISASARRYPGITLTMRDQSQQLVLDSVRGGEVDFGVAIEPQQAEDLHVERIMSDSFRLVCRADHALARRARLPWTALDGAKLVLLDYSSGSRPLIDRALAERGVRCEVVQEVGHLSTAFRMIEAGIGISVVPALFLPAPQSGLVSLPLTPRVSRGIVLLRRRNRSLSPAAEAVWRLMAETVTPQATEAG
ncbi:MAG TPA: LysR family transcriptional regulator [Nevskia sp.]|nr:LysR family transcriptional regulator [Nevskia sp.]